MKLNLKTTFNPLEKYIMKCHSNDVASFIPITMIECIMDKGHAFRVEGNFEIDLLCRDLSIKDFYSAYETFKI